MNQLTINLIEAISEDNNVVSAQLYNDIMRSRIHEKVEAKKKEIAKDIIPKSFNHDLVMKAVTDKNVHIASAAARNAVHPEHHAAILNGKGVHLHTKLALLKNPNFYAAPEVKEPEQDKKEPTIGDFMKHINRFNKGSK